MNTKKQFNAASLLAAASLTFSPAAWSLGLGDVTVESFLNQPLQVRIDLISRETDDLTSVSARLASAADYEMIGASLSSVPVPIGFTVEDIGGDAYIMATSSLPVSEPVVRLIVEVNWSSGRLLREYTVFLDPVSFSEPAPIPRLDQRKSAPQKAAETPVAAAEPAAEDSAPAPEARPAASSPAAREPVDGEYGPVGNGETLWGIASDWSRGTGLNINQVMIALQRENPEAFLKNNINLLKRGAILRMPRIEDVRAISAAAAISEVSAQEEALRERRSAGSATSTSTPLLADETAISETTDRLLEADDAVVEDEVFAEESAEVETVAEALAAEEQAVEEMAADDQLAEEIELSPQLELVPPSADSELDSAYGFEESEDGSTDASVAVSTLREDLARSEEELINQQQQNEYLAQRIAELESQLASTEKDNVEDAAMANMEDRLRQERLAEASAKDEDSPWYSRFSTWLIGLLVLAAAVAGWRFSRRGSEAEFLSGADEEQLREIKDEAEEVLRVLKDPDAPDAVDEDAAEKPAGKAGEKGEAAGGEEKKQRTVKTFGSGGGDAKVLDEESSDPEIQLDLARAYISMGDKEAARVILEEVGNSGSEEQREEARKMLNHLTP